MDLKIKILVEFATYKIKFKDTIGKLLGQDMFEI